MKAGDKAWIFLSYPQEIKEFKVVSVSECEGKTYVTVEWVLDDGRIAYADDFVLGHNIFPSREELCEYYRKIFE